MKSLFYTTYSKNLFQIWLLIFRVALSIFMLTHGLPKLKMLLAWNDIQFIDPIGLGATFSLILVVFAEFFCSLLIILGLGTRFAAIPLIITMLVAVFIFHGAHPFNVKEIGLIYLLCYITLLITGGGKISFDYLIGKK